MGELNSERSNIKFDLWERKLLDLSTRNSLLNLRIKGSCIPLFVPDCAEIENFLTQEKSSFTIIPRSNEEETEQESETAGNVEATEELKAEETKAEAEELEKAEEPEKAEESVAETAEAEKTAEDSEAIKEEKQSKKPPIPAKDYSIEDLALITEFEEYINKKCEKGELVSSLTKAPLDKNIKTLYRGAKASIEENGANTLFLACGFLKWFEKDRKEPCYAPILLIPVELVKKFGIKYTMRRRDEDVQFNITVSEKLRQDFGVQFDDFSKELPTDDNGVDVKAVLDKVSEVVSSLQGWEVVKSCVLGLFSFSQFVMWNDMHSHREQISNNKIVQSLINGEPDEEFKNTAFDETVAEEDVFLPIVADSSQLAAIKMASDGKSFVLHGPPGTGKSQTITSIIANCLANNKKVLFVAEKKAALDVVYNRLDKIGISPFCLELHSNKVRKSYMLDQLKTANEIDKNQKADGDYGKSLEDIIAKRQELDAYVNELHLRHECGMNLYELINVYAKNKSAPDIGSFDDGFISELTPERLNEIETSLGELVASSADLQGRLPFVRSDAYSQEAKNSLAALVESFIKAFDDFASSIGSFENIFVANNGKASGEKGTLAYTANLGSYASWIIYLKSLNLPKGLLCSDDTETAYLAIRDMCVSCKDALAKRDALLTVWQPGFLDLDGAVLLNEIVTAKAKNPLMRGMAENNVYKKVKAYDIKGNRKEVLEQDFKMLSEYKNSVQNAMTFITSARGYLGELYNAGAGFPGFDIAQIEDINEKAHKAFTAFASFDPTGSIRKLIGSGDQSVIDVSNAIRVKCEAYKNTYDALSSTYVFDSGSFDPAEDLLESKKQIAITLRDDSSFLRDRMQFNLMAVKCKTYKISNLVEAYDSGVVDGAAIISSFRKAYSSVLISKIIDNSEVLRTFSGLVFEKKISELSLISDKFEKLTRQEIYLRIKKNLPNLNIDAKNAVGSSMNILQHAIKSGGRGVSIRTLFSQIEKLILQLCPCVLMSPLSCAQFLDPEKTIDKDSGPVFDVVIFDEASQLPTCKAVGVIARGKEAVIVGDPKQMPPTSFFMEQVQEVENFETDDLESILDDCLAVSMPEMHLAWHYRSRHESLITFSNKSFYDGRLFTFPSPDDRQSRVTLVDCGGTFDSGKTRTNRSEALAVIEEIKRYAKDPELSKYSVGVVTFNIQQQSLIEDLLDEEASKDTELEKWAFGSEEPVFIKNLENVQGDERDVILFSVGYGKDETGKLIMNFGPLNRDGGWRRLNVAVTRSRIEMKVFSSISPEEIRINETASEGVKAFKRFLQYAGGSEVWDQDIVSTGRSSDGAGTPVINRDAEYTGIVDDICERFKKAGYDTDKGVGKSGFKIDIGVVSPDKEGAYCLGILLDGPVYKSSGTTTSREVSQISMLKGFGWKVVRVWSLEWWENPDAVFEKLLNLINEPEEAPADVMQPEAEDATEVSAETEAPEEGRPEPQITIYGQDTEAEEVERSAEDQTQKKTTDIGIAIDDISPAVVYPVTDLQLEQMTEARFCFKSNSDTEYLQNALLQIVEQQAPISAEELTKELANLVGITKLSAAVKERCASLIKSVEKKLQPKNQRLNPASEEDETIFFWNRNDDITKVLNYYRVPAEGDKPRKAQNIAIEEAACAANYLARSQYGMPYESLIVATGKELGFSRVPKDSDAYKLGKLATEYCLKHDLLVMNDDGFVEGKQLE